MRFLKFLAELLESKSFTANGNIENSVSPFSSAQEIHYGNLLLCHILDLILRLTFHQAILENLLGSSDFNDKYKVVLYLQYTLLGYYRY